MNKIKIIAFKNCEELATNVNKCLEKKYKVKDSFMTSLVCSRFNNGEGKVFINEDISNKELYILSDVGNYSIEYDFHGNMHCMSPDEHFQDIKRAISATNGRFEKITVIMPLLYESRQHRRKDGESLDCAIALQELESLGVNNIITFDCHDPNVSNAIPNLPFDNVFATETILREIIKSKNVDLNKTLTISPDIGAMQRARYYAEILGCDVGIFYKRRDLSKVVNGKNPIIEHTYLGKSPKDATVFVIDDLIASGSSMIDVARKLTEQGAKQVILVATFSLFTAGIDKFQEEYEKGNFSRLYTTNLTYIPEDIKNLEWLKVVDCSEQLAEIIIEHSKHGNISDDDEETEKDLITLLNKKRKNSKI